MIHWSTALSKKPLRVEGPAAGVHEAADAEAGRGSRLLPVPMAVAMMFVPLCMR